MRPSLATLATTSLVAAAAAALGAVAAPAAQAGGVQPHVNRAAVYGTVEATVAPRTSTVKTPWLDAGVLHNRGSATRLGVTMPEQVMRMSNGNVAVLDFSASSNTLRLFSPSGRQLSARPSTGIRAAVNHEGSLLAWSQGSSVVAMRADGTIAGRWASTAQPRGVVGTTVYSSINEGQVMAWDVATGARRTVPVTGWLVDVNAEGLGLFELPQSFVPEQAQDTCYRLASVTRAGVEPVESCDELRPDGFSRDGRYIIGTRVIDGDVAKGYARVNDARPMLYVRGAGSLGDAQVRADGRALYTSVYELAPSGTWKQAVLECTTALSCSTASPVRRGDLTLGQSPREQVFTVN